MPAIADSIAVSLFKNSELAVTASVAEWFFGCFIKYPLEGSSSKNLLPWARISSSGAVSALPLEDCPQQKVWSLAWNENNKKTWVAGKDKFLAKFGLKEIVGSPAVLVETHHVMSSNLKERIEGMCACREWVTLFESSDTGHVFWPPTLCEPDVSCTADQEDKAS